jgi:hypothetical protein
MTARQAGVVADKGAIRKPPLTNFADPTSSNKITCTCLSTARCNRERDCLKERSAIGVRSTTSPHDKRRRGLTTGPYPIGNRCREVEECELVGFKRKRDTYRGQVDLKAAIAIDNFPSAG